MENTNEQNIRVVLSQTTYTEEEAIRKLAEYNDDVTSVIRDYMGIPQKKIKTEINHKSINQEIYRQIRTNLDKSMKEYRDNNPIDMDQVVNNLNESEERKKIKNKK